MTTDKTGGSAFPIMGMDFRNGQQVQAVFQTGMTLRDYFAAKAMQGELASMHDPEGEVCGVALDAPDETLSRLTTHYYRLADAMLKAREK